MQGLLQIRVSGRLGLGNEDGPFMMGKSRIYRMGALGRATLELFFKVISSRP